MSPPYFFQIDEISQNNNADFRTDRQGNWRPSTDPGANIDYATTGASVSRRQWFCDGQQIREITRRPPGAQPYKTFSVYYIGGVGFSVLEGDARQPPNDDVWHPLQFEFYNDVDYSSFLTNAGQSRTLRLQPQDQRWAHLILPTINHTHVTASSLQYGGLTGELPIFLALMAFSTSRELLPSVLPHTFKNGVWEPTHQWRTGRMDRRGVVVKVWACPANYPPNARQGWTGSSARDLYDYEMGAFGKYYY